MDILAWKKYLKSQNLYFGNVNSSEIDLSLHRGMKKIDDKFSTISPKAKGLVWLDGKINTSVKLGDVKSAMSLIKRLGVADMDALGPPGEDQRSTIFNNMFISQDESNLDEWDPKHHQNVGKWQNDVPLKVDKQKDKTEENQPKTRPNINDRMVELIQLIDSLKK